jgi:hypothetical protein
MKTNNKFMSSKFMTNLTRTVNRAGLHVKKHSPEILLVTGIVAGGTALVAACKATTKLESVLNETKNNVAQVHECAAAGEIRVKDGDEIVTVPYTEEDSKKDLTIFYTKGCLNVAKLYAPAAVLGVVSLTCILASHGIIRKRNTALAAAAIAEATDFKNYRQRVVERFGEELDRELKYNIKAKEVEEVVVQEDGTETVVKKTVSLVDDPNNHSAYARYFDHLCTGYDDSGTVEAHEHNLTFLKLQQKYATQRLQTVGHLFLNEVYEMLGIPHSTAGALVGWVYDEKNPVGDNFVDFGIYDMYSANARDFVNGRDKVILLDFNVDGPIYQLLG